MHMEYGSMVLIHYFFITLTMKKVNFLSLKGYIVFIINTN